MNTATSIPAVVHRAVEQMVEMDKNYNLRLWPSDMIGDRKHDLAVMYRHGDLKELRTDLLAKDRSILVQYKIAIGEATRGVNDDVTAWPVLDCALVAGGRVAIILQGKRVGYEAELRLNWHPADALPQRSGDVYDAEKEQGRFHVSQEHRRRMQVKAVTKAGFAFAHAAGLDADVMLLQKFNLVDIPFQIGQAVSAIVVSTPKGLQGRAIRPA